MVRRLRRTYRRRRRYRPRRRYRRGKARAAATQRQTGRFVVKSMNPGVIQISASGYTGEDGNNQIAPNFAGTACISAFQNLSSSNYFQSLAKMYDQFKLDSFKVKITPTQSVLLQGQKQAVFVSAWDRNGITNKDNVPSFNEIASYGSAFQRTVNLDASSWTATRKIFASTILEKASYQPTSIPDQNNIVNLGNDQNYSFPWNPQLLIGILCTVGVPGGAQDNALGKVSFSGTQSWAFMCEFTWTLTFRGLRYDAPTSAPMVNARMVTNTTAAIGLGKYNVQPTIDQSQLPENVSSIRPYNPPSLGPNAYGSSLVISNFRIERSQYLQILPSLQLYESSPKNVFQAQSFDYQVNIPADSTVPESQLSIACFAGRMRSGSITTCSIVLYHTFIGLKITLANIINFTDLNFSGAYTIFGSLIYEGTISASIGIPVNFIGDVYWNNQSSQMTISTKDIAETNKYTVLKLFTSSDPVQHVQLAFDGGSSTVINNVI